MRKTPELVDDFNNDGDADEDLWTVEVEGSPSRFPLLAKFGIALGALALLFVASLALLPMILPASATVAHAERSISRILGIEVQIKGDHSVRILPTLKIAAENVVSVDQDGVMALTLPYLEIEMSALGALSGSVDLNRFIMRGPTLRIEPDRMAPKTNKAIPEIDRAWGWWRDMSLSDLRIENARIDYTDARSGRALKLLNFNVASDAPGSGQVEDRLALRGKGMLNGQVIDLVATTSDPQLLVSGNRWPFEITATSALLIGSFKGSMAVRERVVGEGDLTLGGADVVALNAWIGPFFPARNRVPMSLNARIEQAGDVMEVRQMNFAFGETSLVGNIVMSAVTSGAPEIDAQFQATTIDFGANPIEDAMAIAEAPLMIPGMPSGKMELTWERMLWRGLEFGAGNATAQRQPATRQLSLQLNDTSVYGGTMRGSLTFDASEGMRALNIEGRAVGVEIGPLLQPAGNASTPILKGKSTLELALFSVGGTHRELIEALTGDAEVVAQSGILTNSELINGLAPEAGGRLSFKSLNASFRIGQGIAASEDLLLRSDNLSLVGKGRIDLANWTIDLDVGRLGTEGDTRSLKRYRVSGPAGDMRVEPINGS